MDSINRNQPEETRADLTGESAIARIRDVIKKTDSCFFCTAVSKGLSDTTRPMSVQQVDNAGIIWFLSANDSHTNLEVAQDPAVRLFFQGSEPSSFLTLTGTASVSTDKGKIKELWKPILKTWFTGGVDDPRITAIAFSPRSGYYWDNKHGDAVAGIKMMLGAAIGKSFDDSIEGKVTLSNTRHA
jgi:general stress protein 26